MTGERRFVLYDGTRFSIMYGTDEIEVFWTPEGALLAASQENGEPNGFIPGPEGRLVRAHPWKAYELVEVTPP